MVRSGDILSNPATGETFYFLKTAADTHGRLLEYEIHAEPGATPALPVHIHPKQDERFEVLIGRITFVLNGKTQLLKPGDSLLVPAGTAHTWRNSGNQTALLLVEMAAAGQHETLIETLCATARNSRFVSGGRRNLLALAVMLDKYRDHLYLAGWPVWAQKAAFAALAFIGRAQGYQAEYSYWECVSEGEREVSIMLA